MTTPQWLHFWVFSASGTSITITRTEIFEPLRKWIGSKSAWLEMLVNCFYCVSHWITFALIAIYRPVLISSGVAFLDKAVSAFFTIHLATLITGVGFKSFRTIINTIQAQEEAKAKLKIAAHSKQ